MKDLHAIRPTVKHRVIDLVSAAGIDVSDWANFKRGPKWAAANPKYCYEWAFVESGRIVVLNLWYGSMRQRKGEVTITLNARPSVRRHSRRGGKEVWRRRAERLDLAMQQAVRADLPVRAIVNDGRMRDADDPEARASRVVRRLLDPLPWAVTAYDWDTGKCVLTRGALPGRLADQFSLQPEEGEVAGRRTVAGMIYIRNPVLRSRALDRAKGRCEYCGQPGFATANGDVFLETHHIVPLGEGGEDVAENIAVLCPNHHREAHHGARALQMRRTLLSRLSRPRSRPTAKKRTR